MYEHFDYIKVRCLSLYRRNLTKVFILNRAILVTSVVRYARKVTLVFIVSTISR